ncbi:MAG: hypothetical protein AAF439_01295 [Pseudomonadota bacterium]
MIRTASIAATILPACIALAEDSAWVEDFMQTTVHCVDMVERGASFPKETFEPSGGFLNKLGFGSSDTFVHPSNMFQVKLKEPADGDTTASCRVSVSELGDAEAESLGILHKKLQSLMVRNERSSVYTSVKPRNRAKIGTVEESYEIYSSGQRPGRCPVRISARMTADMTGFRVASNGRCAGRKKFEPVPKT